MDLLEQNLREAAAEWAKRELDPETPVFTNEELIEVGVEHSDEQVLRDLQATLEAKGSYEFCMRWAFSPEGLAADEAAIYDELLSGWLDVVRQVHRARQLLSKAEVA